MADTFDLIVIGAGSGGLTASRYARRLGAKVALVEKHRIGGDCTWTGCVPSKALLKAAKVAHAARTAAQYGIVTSPPVADLPKVRGYVYRAIEEVHQHESPKELAREGIEVVIRAARFLDPSTILAGERKLTARHFIIATGAHPVVPSIPGLQEVPFMTYEQIFDNERLPSRLLIIGAGPIGVEIAQAYQRLGSQVTLIGVALLPREEPEVAEVIGKVFAREGIAFVPGRATSVRMRGEEVVVAIQEREVCGEMLLVAAGRAPNVEGLDLEKAGVTYSPKGIQVDSRLRTTARHIYAVGDCGGGHQFTHFAAWQAFKAVRNALLPGSSRGFPDVVPWTTFTDPEVARVGLTEAQARQRYGETVRVARSAMARTDRAVCENDPAGFIKVVHRNNGRLLGATIVAERAGETITECVWALAHGHKVADLAGAIHVYPTYSMAVLELAADVALSDFLNSALGKVLQRLSGRGR
jgi:pyruvate/2-oxoglutarate dehydrogenase complex dihydrolipoamide dehydrogenase (E3) component